MRLMRVKCWKMDFCELLLLLTANLLFLVKSGSGIVTESVQGKQEDQNDVINGFDSKGTTYPIRNNKSLSRSKLWSPYSTAANFLDAFEEGNVTDTSGLTTSSDSKVIGIIDGHFDTKSNKESDIKEVTQRTSTLQPSRPIISSIRHYRSRKSFTRVRKGPVPIYTTNKPLAENELAVKADTALDLDREQGDEPHYETLTTSSFTPRSTTSWPKGFPEFVANANNHENRKSGGKANNGAQSRVISSRNDTDTVYGKPYFTSVRDRNSTKMQRIKNFLLRNGTTRWGSETDLRSQPSTTSASVIDLHSQREYEKENAKTNKAGKGFTSKDTEKNLKTKSLFSSQKEPTDENRDDDRLYTDWTVSASYRPSVSSTFTTETVKIRSKGRGNKQRGKGGTRRPAILVSPAEIPNSEPTRGLHQHLSAENGRYTTSDNGEIIIDQSRRTSELYGTVRQQPSLGKLEPFRAEFKSDPKNKGLNEDIKIGNRRGEDGDDSDNFDTVIETDNSSRGNKTAVEFFPSTYNNGMNYSGSNDEYIQFEDKTDIYPNINDGKLTDLSSDLGSNNEKKPTDIVKAFLNKIEAQNEDCKAGTEDNLGEGVVDRYAQERFRQEAEFAVNRANMLTRLWKYTDIEVLHSEYLLHAMVMSIVEFDEDIFAAGNCYDKLQYKNYELYCPFAYRLPEGNILVKDLAVEYKYLSNTSEWFYIARKNAEKVIKNFNQITLGYNTYTHNESAHTERIEDEILNVTYDDGKWSKPYFDCGGGNIWMMTYTVPFFGYKNGTYFFKGTSGIDVDLRRVDIDQCPLPGNSTELNVFAGSDKCKNSTTKCVPIKGLGFRRGSYRCECKDGFYFPNASSPVKYFNGTLMEEEYEKKDMNLVSIYDQDDSYECLKCPEGCDACIDNSPCIVSLNWLMRTAILILQCAIIFTLPIVGLFTWKYADVKVIRAASPVLLRFIVLGAFFIYCTILVMYPSPSVITCTLRVWLREIGFSLAYGALMLKTWRISVIFRVRSAKAVKITDLDLMKRLGIIVAMFTALLVIRTLVAPPVSIISLTADDLKAWLCKSDWWDHSFTIMELSFLVWGIRLCIVVRKAPSEFNESKFISLAIYNEFLLSLFLNISMLFLQSPANPDLLYIIFFCHVQLTMTLLLCLIFGSKAYMVFRGQGKGGSEDSRQQTSKFISKNRSGGPTTKQPSAHNSTSGLHSSTTSTGHDLNVNSRFSEDVQEEFRRLYYQLEELKERNMRLGNRHLVAKITAMQEAADNILSGGVNTHRLQPPSSSPGESAFGTSPSSKGKNVTLSDISEEENAGYPTSSENSNSRSSKPVARVALVSGLVGTVKATMGSSPTSETQPNKKGILIGIGSISVSNNRSNSCVPKSDSKSSRVGDGGGEDSQSHLDVDASPSENEVQVGDHEMDLDIDDDDMNVIESNVSPEGDPSSSLVGSTPVEPDYSNEFGCESIPLKTISTTSQHHPTSRRPNNKTHRASVDGNFASGSKSISESQTGKRKLRTQIQQQPAKNQNHTGGAAGGGGGNAGIPPSKIVLDLDDKSRFTEEITV